MDDENEADASKGRVAWTAVGCYYAIACAISWPLFWWRDRHPASWARWDAPGFAKGWAPALGPALGALIVMTLFRGRHRRSVTLLGTSPARSLAFVGVTLAALAGVGVGDDEPHLTGLVLGLIYLVYGLGEELGWRGYLQDALGPLRPRARYALIGILWGTWHFTTFARGTSPGSLLFLAGMYTLWILGSWGIGVAVEGTRSLLVATMLHLIFNFSSALPGTKAAAVLGTSAVAWIVLLRTWPKPRPG